MTPVAVVLGCLESFHTFARQEKGSENQRTTSHSTRLAYLPATDGAVQDPGAVGKERTPNAAIRRAASVAIGPATARPRKQPWVWRLSPMRKRALLSRGSGQLWLAAVPDPRGGAPSNRKSCTTCHAVANEHPARRAASATLTSGSSSSTVQTSARQVGPISTRLR